VNPKSTNIVFAKAIYGSLDYYEGLSYLLNYHPNNFHIKACYEGVTFQSLAQCLFYDRNGSIRKSANYLKKPVRFLIKSKSNNILGVMVTVSLPEFYDKIDYEDYAIIITDNIEIYKKTFHQLSFKGKAEIVTFSPKQAGLVDSKFSIGEIHNWSVYLYRDHFTDFPLMNIKLIDKTYLQKIKQLSTQLPIEASPYRSAQFQLNGLPYKNYFASFGKDISVYMGISCYTTGVYKVHYILGLPATDWRLIAFVKTVSKLVNDWGCKLVWRLRKNEVNSYSRLLKQVGYVEVSKEIHMHLNH